MPPFNSLISYFMICFVLLYINDGFASLPSNPLPNFNIAKKQIRKIYMEHRETFFCSVPFDEKEKLQINICPNCPKKSIRIQWMHIVSPHLLTKQSLCLNEKICQDKNGRFYKGIICCRKTDLNFNHIESDLHNIIPEIAFFKSQCLNYTFGEIKKTISNKAACHFIVDKQKKIVSPDPAIRGMIARIILYMHDTYLFSLKKEEIALYQKWHQKYPPTSWERQRDKQIQKIQGNRNHYIN